MSIHRDHACRAAALLLAFLLMAGTAAAAVPAGEPPIGSNWRGTVTWDDSDDSYTAWTAGDGVLVRDDLYELEKHAVPARARVVTSYVVTTGRSYPVSRSCTYRGFTDGD